VKDLTRYYYNDQHFIYLETACEKVSMDSCVVRDLLISACKRLIAFKNILVARRLRQNTANRMFPSTSFETMI